MITSQSLVKGCENIKPKAKWFVSSLLENYDLAEVSSQAGKVRCCEGQEGDLISNAYPCSVSDM